MHLPRLWTDAPVAKKTQVNSTTNQNGTDRKGGATNRSRPEQKGPNRADKGGQNKKTRRPKRQRGETRGATQQSRGKEEMGYV